MRMESFTLAGHHVRITWNGLTSKQPHNEQTIFRGEVSHQDNIGLWLLGSFFIERAETLSVREVPRDKEIESRLFFAPWTSIEAVQIIEEGSPDYETHLRILARRTENTKKTTAR